MLNSIGQIAAVNLNLKDFCIKNGLKNEQGLKN